MELPWMITNNKRHAKKVVYNAPKPGQIQPKLSAWVDASTGK